MGPNTAPANTTETHTHRDTNSSLCVPKCCRAVAQKSFLLAHYSCTQLKYWMYSCLSNAKAQFSLGSTKREKSHSTLEIPPTEVPLKAS